jgi:hypothetical protein
VNETSDLGSAEHRDYLLPDVLVEAARRVIDANRAAGRTVAVAESCTGGLVGAALTEIPGSSDVLIASIVSYANEAKISLLGVGSDIIETFGSVSVATAWAVVTDAPAPRAACSASSSATWLASHAVHSMRALARRARTASRAIASGSRSSATKIAPPAKAAAA